MRLQILLVSLLVSGAHGFMFSPLMMALLRFRMGAQRTPMMRSPFALLERMRRNQMANLRSIMTRRQNMIRNRMGIGRGSGQRQNIQTTATINPERLKPFGGTLGGIPQPSVVTVDNSPNVMSGIGAGVLLNQLDYPAANINNGGSSVIVGPLRQPPVTVDGAITGANQIITAGPNMVPQQQVAMSNILDLQQQQIAQNGVIGPIQAANIVAPQQQLVTTNVGPSIVEIAQQVPNIAMGQAQTLQATNMISTPQQQLGNGFTTNVGPSVIEVAQQVPNVAMGQFQNLQGTNLIAQPQQFVNGFTTNAGIAQQQLQNAVMGQAQNLQGANMIAQPQQLGNGFTTNAGIAQQQLQNAVMGQAQNLQGANLIAQPQQLGNGFTINAGIAQQQLQNAVMGQNQNLQATNMIAQPQQLGNGFTTNIGSSVIGTVQPQLTNLAMNQAQTLQAANLISAPQQQQFGNGFTTNAGPPVIGVAQQQVPNLAMGQAQNLQATNLIATPQQQLGNAFATNVGPTVMEATQQQVNILGNPTSTISNQIGQMTMSDPQLVNLDNAIASTQQQISAIQNGIAEAKLRDQIIAMNSNVAQQAQLRSGASGSMIMNPTQLDANTAINAQQQLIDANNAINLQQQLIDANNAINAQQQLVDANNAINEQRQIIDANNAINAQQQLVDANNAINAQQQLVDANNVNNLQQQLANVGNPQQQLIDANNNLNLEQQQIIDINNAITLQQQLANAGNPTQQEIASTEQFQQPQLLEMNNAIQNPLRGDMSNVLSSEQQQMGSALIGSNIVIDPSQQQPTDIGMAAEPQPQQIGPIGTNVEPGNTQMSEIANVAGINEQLTGASIGLPTPFGLNQPAINNPMNPLQQYGQVIGPNGPIEPYWQMGTVPGQPGGIPYIDPMTELALVQDPYAQQMLYSNTLTNPAFVNGVPQPSGQLVDQPALSQQPGAVQTPTGQGITQTLKQGETLPAQGSLAAQQPVLNTQPQQVGAHSQLGPWDPTQLQNSLQEPWLSNLQPDPNQPYLVNDPSLSGLQKALQNNLNIQMRPEFQYVYADSQQPNGVMSNSAAAAAIQAPTPAQLGQLVQQPQATQLTSSTQIDNITTGITNTAPQQSVAALDTPVVPQATATASGTVQQNGPLSDQSLQYRQAILDSILSSLQPQVVYNPINGFDVPADAPLASAAVQSNNPTLTAAASGSQADIGQNPTSPQPSFTVSDVLRNLAAGGQVANLPVQKTILADKIPTNVQPDQQAVIASQMDLNRMTTPSPLPIARQNPIQYAIQTPLRRQVPYYGAQRQSSQSSYMQPNDFWGEMALASAIFNHPKQPLPPKQQQENSQKQKQQQQMLDSLIRSIMLASMQPKKGAVKQATSAIKLPTVVTRGDLKPFLPAPIKQNSSTSLLSTDRNLGSPLQPATLGITLPPVSPQTKDNFSSSVVRSPQPGSNFITKVPLFNA